MLEHQGHRVRILEQDSREPETHMAEVGAASDMLQFLKKHDKVEEALGIQ